MEVCKRLGANTSASSTSGQSEDSENGYLNNYSRSWQACLLNAHVQQEMKYRLHECREAKRLLIEYM